MTQRIIMLAGTCGQHHVKDCDTCTAATDCTNAEIRRLHSEIEVWREALEQAADNLRAAAKLHQCSGAQKAEQLAREKLAVKP